MTASGQSYCTALWTANLDCVVLHPSTTRRQAALTLPYCALNCPKLDSCSYCNPQRLDDSQRQCYRTAPEPVTLTVVCTAPSTTRRQPASTLPYCALNCRNLDSCLYCTLQTNVLRSVTLTVVTIIVDVLTPGPLYYHCSIIGVVYCTVSYQAATTVDMCWAAGY
jgi:hypothetical protein